MKIITQTFVIAAFLLAVNFIAPTANAQTRTPKTVVDFYLLLPAKYITPLAKVKKRDALIETRDVANGYLKLANNGVAADWEGWAEIALFKKADNNYVVGVVNGECATICTSGVEFLEYQNGKWREVTARVMPKISNKMIVDAYRKQLPEETDPPYTSYELPQQGTVMRLNANVGGDGDVLLYELKWNGAKFEIKK